MTTNNYEPGKIEFDKTSIIITDPVYFTMGSATGPANFDDWDKCDYGEHMEHLGFTRFKTLGTGFGDGYWDAIDIKTGGKIGRIWADSGQTGIYILDEAIKHDSEAMVLKGDRGGIILKDFTGVVSWKYRIKKSEMNGETTECHYLVLTVSGKCGDEEIYFIVDFENVAEDEGSSIVMRNFENYSTRYDALLVFEALEKRPYWFKGDDTKTYFAVDFDEWIWLPVSDNPACPVEWKKKYLGIDKEV